MCEGDVKTPREGESQKVSQEDEDQKVSNDVDNQKESKEGEDQKVSKEGEDQKGLKEDDDQKGSKEVDDRKGSKGDDDWKVSKEDDDQKGSKEADDRRVSKEANDWKGSKEADDRRVSKEADNREVSKEADDQKVSKETVDQKVSKETVDQKVSKASEHFKSMLKEADDRRVSKAGERRMSMSQEGSHRRVPITGERRKSASPTRRRSLSPAPYPGAKPITTGLYLEPHHLVGKLWWTHHFIQSPVYFVKWILAQLVAIMSLLCWRLPKNDQEIVNIVENTSLIIVLRRDFEAEKAEKIAFASRKGCDVEGVTPLYETRHYYVDVKRCELDMLIREPKTTYKSFKGVSTKIKSWSMSYTKTRRREGMGGGPNGYTKNGEGSPAGAWDCQVTSFVVNNKPMYEREKIFAFLFHYHSCGTHVKSHVMGNALCDRILLDDRVREKLSESTWTTTALHYGLVYGTFGPMTEPRTPEKQWMAIGMIPTCDSLLAEGANMSALGPQHADKTHWVELDIPFADFLLNARMVLTRVMKKNDIPPDLHEAIFLSCIVHAADHTQLHRVLWGKHFNPDPQGKPGNWLDHWESAAWRYMWAKPTLNPFWNNKICRSRKPFYRQLYLGLRDVDTFNVSRCITASIMY